MVSCRRSVAFHSRMACASLLSCSQSYHAYLLRNSWCPLCSRVRQRQLQHGVLAAAPGHPALKEVCDRVAANLGASSSGHPILDALERTGPGVLTDSVLAFAEEHARTDKSGPWGVRILSQSAFGVPGATPCDRLLEETSATSAGHGANRAREGGRASHWWPFKGHYGGAEVAEGSSMQPPAPLSGIVGAYVGSIEAQRAEERLYPVSAVFDPPYEMMTHLIGHGDRQSGSDVSASITQHGAWQPSVQPWRRPTLTEALVGSLGAVSGKGGALIDVGAGYGTISLAAAARGHRVHAFELSARSVEALEASIERNGFGGLIDVHKVALGAPSQRGTACLALHANATWARAATAAAAAADLARGYSNPAAHAVDASACARRIPRLPGSEAVPTGVRVGAIRLSANGWEGFVLDGLLPLIQRQRPPVIAVEWNPTAMLAAGHTAPLDVVHRLVALGYADVSHSGFMCDERWYAITYGVRRRGGMVPEEIAGLKQPTWCRLLPGEYHVLLDKADGKYPETLLFINKESGKAGGHQSRSDRGTGGGESGVAAAEHASAHDAAKAVESLSAAEDVGSLPEGTDAGHMRDSELEVPRMKR